MSQRGSESGGGRVEARDRGLRRVRTATGWITVASAAGVVVLAGGYAQALPGKSTGSGAKPNVPVTRTSAAAPKASATTAAPTAARTAASASAASPSAAATSAATSAPALQAPAQAPTTAAASSAHATSGGS